MFADVESIPDTERISSDYSGSQSNPIHSRPLPSLGYPLVTSFLTILEPLSIMHLEQRACKLT